MKLFFDKQTNVLSAGLGGRALTVLSLPLGLHDVVLVTLDGGRPWSIPTNDRVIQLGLANAANELLALCEDWTQNSVTKHWHGVLDLSTQEMLDAIAADAVVSTQLAISHDNLTPYRSQLVPTTVSLPAFDEVGQLTSLPPAPDDEYFNYTIAQTLTAGQKTQKRADLGLVIGTDVQAYDPDLAAIAALTTNSFGRDLLTQSSGAAVLTYIGGAGLTTNTFTGKQNTAASATGAAGLNVPHGTAPTSPVDGDIWTTSSAAFFRINGSTIQLADNALVAKLSGGNTIAGPQTLTGQTELTGQAATNSTSAMTRGLSDTRYGRLYFARKTSDTVRSGVGPAQRTADPTLAFSGLDTGTYEVEFRGIFSASLDSTAFYVAIGYSNIQFHTTSDIWVARTRHDTGVSSTNRLRSTSIGDTPITNAGAGDWAGSPLRMTVVMRGTVNVIAGQTAIEVDWAQNVLDAGQTATLLSGAYLSIRKVA